MSSDRVAEGRSLVSERGEQPPVQPAYLVADRVSSAAPEWSRPRSAWAPCDVPSFTGDSRDRTLALLQEALRTDEAATALLASLQAHVAALALVAEAASRGAVILPPGVAHAVSVAREVVPDFLRGPASRSPARRAAAAPSEVLWAPTGSYASPD